MGELAFRVIGAASDFSSSDGRWPRVRGGMDRPNWMAKHQFTSSGVAQFEGWPTPTTMRMLAWSTVNPGGGLSCDAKHRPNKSRGRVSRPFFYCSPPCTETGCLEP